MCDTWTALQDVTHNRQVIFAKNSDRPIFDCQALVRYPRQTWPAGSTLKLEYVEIPQVEVTYANLGSSPYWCWGYEEGLNEYGVAIGNEAIYTKQNKASTNAHRAGTGPALGLLGMDLIRLALERSQTAQQAVRVIGELVEQYGQFGSGVPAQDHAEGSYDNAFLIADSQEAWVVETAGRRWVAQKFTGGSLAISNEPTITNEWDDGSADIQTYAQEQGWWPEGQKQAFSFARAYIDETMPRQVSHIRAMRARQLLTERAGDIDPAWMKRIARDHYEDTFLSGPLFDAADPDFHSLCMHVSPADFTWGNTASSCVVTLPKTKEALPVFWWTPGPPCNGCYVPFFAQGDSLPAIVSRAGTAGKRIVPPPQAKPDTFHADSYWWLFRELMDTVKGDPIRSLPGYYPKRNRQVRARFDALENTFAAELPGVLQQAITSSELINTELLDAFSAQCIAAVVQTITGLLNEF